MLQKEDLEAVVMAPPLWLHAEMAVACLEAGKHVLCEKMMAWDVDGCRNACRRRRRRTGRLLEIGYQRFYNPVYQAAYDGIVKAGVLGDVYHARLAWHRNGNWRRNEEPPAPDYDPSRWGYPDLGAPGELAALLEVLQGPARRAGQPPGQHRELVLRRGAGGGARGAGGVYRFKDGREVEDHVYATFEYPDGPHRRVLHHRVQRVRRLLRDVHGHEGHAHPEPRDGRPSSSRRASDKATAVEVAAKGVGPGPRVLGDPAHVGGRAATAAAAGDTGERPELLPARDLGVLRGHPHRPPAPLRAGQGDRLGAGLPRRATRRYRRRRGWWWHDRRALRPGPPRAHAATAPSTSSSTETLRDAIMRCELGPGQRLVIDDLARRLEVSAIPVREALQLLQSEGLVANVPHVGATVSPISRESIAEVFTLMEGLEIVATRARRRAHDARRTRRSWRRSWPPWTRALAAGRNAEWADLNSRFHLAISRLSAMPMLHEMTERVLARWDRVRRYYFKGVLVQRVEQAQEEHRAMLRSMKAAISRALERMVKQHNQGALLAYASEFIPGRGGMSWPRVATAQDQGGLPVVTWRRRVFRSRSTTPSFPPRPRPSPVPSRRAACARATASASCPWKAGTGPGKASPAS